MTDIFRLPIERPVTLIGRVKWFNTTKGFGFVVVDGMEQDFLLHRNVLHGYGQTSVADQAMIEFDYEQAGDRFRVSEILRLDAPEEASVYDFDPTSDQVSPYAVPVRVKWFDTKKGYGFVNAHGSDEDIFVGQNVLRQNAMQELRLGQALSVRTADNAGRLVVYSIHDWLSDPES